MAATPRFSPTVYATIASIEASRGPETTRYAIPLDRPVLYRWAVGDTSTDDTLTCLSASGGPTGRWLEVRMPDKGANLADGNATIYVSGNRWRLLPAATLTGNSTLTLGTTGAVAGDWIEITRLDVGAYTYAIVNGGAGAGTLATMPVSVRARLLAYFDGTNWLHRDSALML
jgi:hypothetical protein